MPLGLASQVFDFGIVGHPPPFASQVLGNRNFDEREPPFQRVGDAEEGLAVRHVERRDDPKVAGNGDLLASPPFNSRRDTEPPGLQGGEYAAKHQVDVAPVKFVEHQPPAPGRPAARLHHAAARPNPTHTWPGGGRELLPVTQHCLQHHPGTEGIFRQLPHGSLTCPRIRGQAEQAPHGLEGGPVCGGSRHHRVVPQGAGYRLGQAGLSRARGAGEDHMAASLELGQQLGRELSWK